MPTDFEASGRSLFRVVNDQGVMDALGVVTVVRLGILFAGEVSLLSGRTTRVAALCPVAVVGVCWICYQGLRRPLPLFLHDWFLVGIDLIMTGLLLLGPIDDNGNVDSLWLAYVLVSAMFIGLAITSLWSAVWAAGMISCVVLFLEDRESSSGGSLLTIFGIASGVVLGNRWRQKVWRIGELSSEAAKAREERQAISVRLSIARDLHDSLAKSVHGIRMLSETLDSVLCREKHPYAHLSHTLFDAADEASREARIVLDGLRVGGEENVVGALKESILRWARRTSITPVFSISERLGYLSSTPDAMWQLQRIVGELLVNVEKHSGAEHLYFAASVSNDQLILEIGDDGCGLDASLWLDAALSGHYGIQGIKERASLLGATIEFTSPPDECCGMCVKLMIPCGVLTNSKEAVL